jgi:hypothetical protein
LHGVYTAAGLALYVNGALAGSATAAISISIDEIYIGSEIGLEAVNKIGGVFRVAIDETGKTYPARFVRKGARVDPVSQSIKVTGTVDGQFPELITGMSGRLLVRTPQR